MSFSTFPAALPYVAAVHENDVLDKLVESLSKEEVTDLKVTEVVDSGEVSSRFVEAFDKMVDLKDGKDVALTDNGALTNTTTQDACLDLFYGIDNTGDYQKKLLDAAWEQDRDFTLHIIFYARSIHRGKSLKEAFFSAFCWLLQKSPKTAIRNLHVLIDGTIKTDAALQDQKRRKKAMEEDGFDMVAESKVELRRDFKTHGYWKDLATILTIYCQGELDGPGKDTSKAECSEFKVRRNARGAHKQQLENNTYKALSWPKMECKDFKLRRDTRRAREQRCKARREMDTEEREKDAQHHIQVGQKKTEEARALAKEQRLAVRHERNQHVGQLLEKDNVYQALHVTIARLFADQLRKDVAQMEENKGKIKAGQYRKYYYALSHNLSLAAKWAPSLGFSHDKHTFLATTIAENLFPPITYQEKDETRVHYLNKVRELYRKQYLSPLRAALDLTEHHMAPGKWNTIDYRHVPAVCLEQNIGKFFQHSPDELILYMEKVATGEKKVSGSTLQPNQLVYKVFYPSLPESLMKILNTRPEIHAKFMEMGYNLVNGQWDTLINSIRNAGKIDNPTKGHVGLGECMAVCDVSGSMYGGGDSKPENQPIFAAIGLSMVISNLAKPPFNGRVITFTDVPSLLKIDTSMSFSNQVEVVKRSDAGYNTNIRAVFIDLLLPMAKKYELRQEDMIKRLFIFSDMEFDCGYTGSDEFLTTYEFIKDEYKKAGYEVPELVWWNLATPNKYDDQLNAPVTKDNEGVALLSGFSASMVKTFLDGDMEEEAEASDQSEKSTNKPKKAKMTPYEFMKKAVYHESFQGLQVFA
ncbi:hypothetical protein K501DRAFT_282743 [Backusella circina FSU 941]|nr:hypothetical protein K501DRAFT_282743 [Backusella circina FSU 941]